MGKGKSKGGGMALRGGISELMRQAHRMQTKLEKVKEEIKEDTWTAEAAGGTVKVTINGARELTEIEINKDLIDPEDAETLQDVVVSAVNAALTLAEEKINDATEGVTGGMKIPGMF
ncbi:MAG: YbaB/EbfC family nucleoid-associated protein [Deltaproteobacteria bacterium]|nr:YbaB/EbfC family nucleoid-associated protein [Deltaproteobacteria bacterium]